MCTRFVLYDLQAGDHLHNTTTKGRDGRALWWYFTVLAKVFNSARAETNDFLLPVSYIIFPNLFRLTPTQTQQGQVIEQCKKQQQLCIGLMHVVQMYEVLD